MLHVEQEREEWSVFSSEEPRSSFGTDDLEQHPGREGEKGGERCVEASKGHNQEPPTANPKGSQRVFHNALGQGCQTEGPGDR